MIRLRTSGYLGCLLLSLLLAMLATGWGAVFVCGLSLALALVFYRAGLAPLRRGWIWGLIAILILSSTLLSDAGTWKDGLALGAQMALRALAILVAVAGFTASVSVSELASALEGAGLRGLGFALGVAFNMLPVIQETASTTYHALRLRGGFRRARMQAVRSLLVTIVVNSLRHADDIVSAAEARAFSVDGPPAAGAPSGDQAAAQPSDLRQSDGFPDDRSREHVISTQRERLQEERQRVSMINQSINQSLYELLERSATSHHHLCPKQVLGVRMGLWAGELLGLDLPRSDKRLLAIMETDGCSVDGVSSATGCTVGHRTLRIEDYGKVAATFVDTENGAAWRITPSAEARQIALDWAPEASSPWEAQLLGYQRMPDELLLQAQRVILQTPLEQIISRPGLRQTCACCGEEIINERWVCRGEDVLCRSCAGQGYYRASAAPGETRPAELGLAGMSLRAG